MGFQLPERAKVGYLDPEIAGEGTKVILSDGEQITWNEPPPKPVMPDWSGIKSLKRYFNRTGFQVWPAWLYHPTEPARLVKNAQEAGELGVCYREATNDERARYGLKTVWDWQDDSQWRPNPYGTPKFDPKNPGQGKTYVAAVPNPSIAQNDLLRELVPLVTAAVVAAVKGGGGPAMAAGIDASLQEEFLRFVAWKKSSETIGDALKEDIAASPDGEKAASDAGSLPLPANGVAANALSAGNGERTALEAQARAKGLRIDGRWSLDKLKAELAKA
jgi:hypothetical protein